MNRQICVAAVVAAVGIAQSGEFGGGLAARAKPRTIRLSVTMADGIDHRLRSNLGQTYTDGVGGVVATDSGAGPNFQPGTRGLLHEFSVCLVAPCTPPYVAGTGVNIVQIRPLSPDGLTQVPGLLALPLNESRPAFMKILLTTRAENGFWTLCADPRADVAGICGANVSHLGVRIARTGAGTWVVSGSGDGPGLRNDVFDLLSEISVRNRSTIAVEGTFSMPFAMTIQCLNAADCPAPN